MAKKDGYMDQVYFSLAEHLKDLVMGFPFSEELINLLREVYDREEAATIIGLPNDLDPLITVSSAAVAAALGRSAHEVGPVLDRLAAKNLIYSGPTPEGEKGYALLQVGYGMPQTFFWNGRMDDRAKKLGWLVYKYFNTKTTAKIYGGVPTKSYRYVPVDKKVEAPLQGVMPYERMESIIRNTDLIGLAHCPCRVAARAGGLPDCGHSLEVCLKYDELAEFVIAQGLARPVSNDEALHILDQCEAEGLVHMVDNSQGRIKHTCNCCGHYCWNVGLLNRRRVPRDSLMAVYFLRRTELEECIGCGACAEICPVSAVAMVDGLARVDLDWCLGCGVCVAPCPVEAISIVRRDNAVPPRDTTDMFQRMRDEKKAIKMP